MVRTHVQDKFVTVNGIRIHYAQWGDAAATPLCLLHGLRGFAHAWEGVAEAFADRFRVLALDQRGRGASDWAPDGDYTTPAYVRDFAAFADALGLRRFVLAGHSMGGRNSIVYAAEHPDRVAALIVVDVGPETDPRGLERIRQEMRACPEEFASWEEARRFVLKERPGLGERDLRLRLEWTLKEEGGRIVWRYDRAIRDARRSATPPPMQDLWPSVARIRCPTLVVRGERSDILAREGAEKFVAALAQGELAEVPAAGHGVFEDNPEGFNRVVGDFLARHGLLAG